MNPDLSKNFHTAGIIEWIGIRPAAKMPLSEKKEAHVSPENGLENDHYTGTSGKRQLTLIQKEHIDVVAQMMDQASIDPGQLRRNIVVSGINLLAQIDKHLQIGEAIIEITGSCVPCKRMEENLGHGGYSAMVGHGGVCARIISSGSFRLGDSVTPA